MMWVIIRVTYVGFLALTYLSIFRAFYDDYHRYLEAQGVDGVKVDVQSFLNCVGSGFGGSVALTRAYHKALSKSIATHFPDEVFPKNITIHSFF